MLDTPEYELIERAQAGNADAVASLYRRYVPAITRYIGYRVSDPAVVEDLTAEVFLRMVEGLPRYQITGAPFEAWLYRIAAARIADYYRQSRPAQELNETLDGNEPPLDLNLQQQEELAELHRALSQLNEDQQTILVLRFVERKSHEEVATLLGKSIDAIATAQHRALKRLAELMGTKKGSRHYLRGKLR